MTEPRYNKVVSLNQTDNDRLEKVLAETKKSIIDVFRDGLVANETSKPTE